MPDFTPIRPSATRLLIPLPLDLHDTDRTLAASLSRQPSQAEAAKIAVQALNLAVPCKAEALAGFLRTLDPNQRTAVVTRNTLEEAAAAKHAALAGTAPTANAAQWRSEGGTLILRATPDTPHHNLSSALYLIFLGRPLRLATLRRLENMAAVDGPQAPPYLVHLIASPSLDSQLADILLSTNASRYQPRTRRKLIT